MAGLRATTAQEISPKLNLNSNLAKSRSSITTISVAPSFWNFAQSMAVILPCSVQYFKMIGEPRKKIIGKPDFMRLEFKMSFLWISNIVTTTWLYHNPGGHLVLLKPLIKVDLKFFISPLKSLLNSLPWAKCLELCNTFKCIFLFKCLNF